MTAAFLDRTSNMFGALKPDVRARLERVIAVPSERNWEDAYSIILDGRTLTTLWQAWIAVDPRAPRCKPHEDRWSRVPDQLTLYRALKYATEPRKPQ